MGLLMNVLEGQGWLLSMALAPDLKLGGLIAVGELHETDIRVDNEWYIGRVHSGSAARLKRGPL